MDINESEIAGHYTTDQLLERILAALGKAGVDPENATASDLKGVDEFHTGGLLATDDLLEQLQISPQTKVLDIGCGIGGAARHIANTTGATVTGVDLTPDYIDTAVALSELVGMQQTTRFQTGSALDIPVPDDSYDLATMFHVGMNISNKQLLFKEAARVLTSGATFALFDVMQLKDGELTFPLPWAEKAEWSVVETPETYIQAASAAGFEVNATRTRADFAISYFEKAFAAIAKTGSPPPIGIHLLMRDTGAQKLRNYLAEVKAGHVAPVELILQLK